MGQKGMEKDERKKTMERNNLNDPITFLLVVVIVVFYAGHFVCKERLLLKIVYSDRLS